MKILYDGSFDGLMSVVFDCYEQKMVPTAIIKMHKYQPEMFDQVQTVETNAEKTKRVIDGLHKKMTSNAFNQLFKAFHSEFDDIELTIFNYIRLVISTKGYIGTDYRQEPILRIKQVVKMMNREIHRMHAFVRFQLTVDGIYAATVNPDFDVMPFIGEHFRKRYADQLWLIYDVQRDYGIYYDMQKLQTIHIENPEWTANKKIKDSLLADKEKSFQNMWQQYFSSTSIAERKNMKLHLQHVPKRYWKYLPEKSA
ncbi:DNA metabolism protein [Fulvivirga sp. RKSG066]|uniref:TIGR03915 family putative DNA repair protein n=1 Tax=Fulvivirga aurantia TaxID=2529383 RepID=UPI0012BC19ED|nr:TIGR03915 family putative DNA repair protein [Fulvivirga aurantia]MTI21909.1 DNA metabolism protein [Fulvivirga aurantia]